MSHPIYTLIMALNLLSLAPLLGYAFALPQSQPSASPNIQNLAMWGTGCPLGAAGLMSGVRNGTPIFSFSEWGLVLPNVDDPESETTASKFCTEEITLNNGPVGFQLRIETVTVGGWAELEEGTKLVVEAETKLGDVVEVCRDKQPGSPAETSRAMTWRCLWIFYHLSTLPALTRVAPCPRLLSRPPSVLSGRSALMEQSPRE